VLKANVLFVLTSISACVPFAVPELELVINPELDKTALLTL
jgi:hypothetical protein